jgi:hypothetical protein
MMKHISSIAFTTYLATLSLAWMPAAQAKQQCTAAMPTKPHTYWSWRLIGGRKCWYEGKPMLSKSLLEWPTRISAQSGSGRELASAATDKISDPPEAQTWAPAAANTFEALWRARVELHQVRPDLRQDRPLY